MASRLRGYGRLSCTLIVFMLSSRVAPLSGQERPTFDDWKSRCLSVPANRVLRGRMPDKEQLPLKQFESIHAETRRLLRQFQGSQLSEPLNWVGEKPKRDEFFDIDRGYYTRSPIPFQPFAMKKQIPAGSQVILHGDLHGDIRSLISTLVWLNEQDYLDGFKLKQPNTYFVFLGDYVDRGSYGVEVLYTLMRLKLENPDQLLMARGNHEDFKMTATYGFLREGQMKYGREFNPLPLWRVYDFLPVVIYLGTGNDYAQCNHGGMEPGYDPKSLLAGKRSVQFQFLDELKQKSFLKEHSAWLRGAPASARAMAAERLADFRPASPVEPHPIGFMWNDFFVFQDEPAIGYNASRLAFDHGQSSAKYLLKAASSKSARLRAVFRAHQHSRIPNPAMNRIIASNGVFRHWQTTDAITHADANKQALQSLLEHASERAIPEGSVWTFNVSPDSVYGDGNDYAFDTIGILSTGQSFSDWRMRIVNIPVTVK